MMDAIAAPDHLTRIRSEYYEMPGLKLTAAQASRFWNLDPEASRRLLEALVDARVLRRTVDGHYVLWADQPSDPVPPGTGGGR